MYLIRYSRKKLMRALVLDGISKPLSLVDTPIPTPGINQVLLRVHACGICHTDSHIIEGELNHPKLPLILGHQVVAHVVECGPATSLLNIGDRVGVPWLGGVDGTCSFCVRGQENLCDHPLFTGYTLNGGFAEYMVADEKFCFLLPEKYGDCEAAPLLCAGLIGYRTYCLAGEDLETIGIYGFGAAAHLVAQVAKFQGKKVYAFTRPGDEVAKGFALRNGADWAGDSLSDPPKPLDAALIFAPVGDLIPIALKAVRKGGTVVCGGIHMSDVPSFSYSLLWEERMIRSVANLTRNDGIEFMSLAARIPLRAEISIFPFEEVISAFDLHRRGNISGAAVITFS